MIRLAQNGEQMHTLISELDTEFSRELQITSNREALLMSVKKVYYPGVTLLYLIIFFSGVSCFIPGISMLAQFLHGTPVQYSLEPLYVSPFHIEDGGLLFYIEYLHIYAAGLAVISAIGIDMLFTYLVFMMTGLLNVSSLKIDNYEFDGTNEEELKAIFLRHQKIKERMSILSDVYQVPIFALFASGATVMCSGIYQVSMVSITHIY